MLRLFGESARGFIAKAQDRAVAMGAGLRRIQDLVLNLRRFSRMDEGGFQLVDIFEAIDTVLTLLSPKLGDRIVIGESVFSLDPPDRPF